MPCGLSCADADIRKARNSSFTSTETVFATTKPPKLELNGKPCCYILQSRHFLCQLYNFAVFHKRNLQQHVAYVVERKRKLSQGNTTVPLQSYEMLCMQLRTEIHEKPHNKLDFKIGSKRIHDGSLRSTYDTW